MLEIGEKMPEFKALDQDGNEFDSKSLMGKKCVIYFYPKDNTPGCTKEACNLRDNYEKFLAQGYTIIGISKDSVSSHKNFHTKYELPFRLLSDPSTEILQSFGAWGEKKNYGKVSVGTLRSTFIFDENSILIRRIKSVKTAEHSSQILAS